ncbi:MAG: oxidoreductase FAD/NAD(P)-binding domain protein [Jatrophihabitantaceae bacterium]|nr:oxidoreductase FAD/NAD(P)-binding domain protein [Jatrophihabitantaceae bacterium]
MVITDLEARPTPQMPRQAAPGTGPQPAWAPGRQLPVSAAPLLVLTLMWGGAASTVAWWWLSTASVHGLAGWLIGAGRVTGLGAGYAMAVLLILMARIPWLDRAVGTDRLVRWHAMGGRYAVSLVVAHAALILWGYSVSAHANPVEQAKSLLLSYPDVLMATVAGALLVAVGISSARAARRRLQYETWHLLHLYTYLAIALSFSHTFATGEQFTSSAPARWAWSGLYLGAAGAVVWFRFLVPIVQSLRHRLTVAAVRLEGPGLVSIYFSGKNLHRLDAQAGQFFRWRFLTKDLWWAANPYSLTLDPATEGLRITVKVEGRHSEALMRLAPGTRVFAEGPAGGLTAARRRRRKVLLIAGGVGVTPLRAMFASLPADYGDLTLLVRAASWPEVPLRAELDAIARRRGARVGYLVGRRAQGYDPLHASALQQLVPDLRDHDVFLCGPEGMTAAAHAALRQAGVPRRRIHTESFAF